MQLFLAVEQHAAVHAPDLQRATGRIGVEGRADVGDIAVDQCLHLRFETGADDHPPPDPQPLVVQIAPGSIQFAADGQAQAELRRQFVVHLHLQAEQVGDEVGGIFAFDLD